MEIKNETQMVVTDNEESAYGTREPSAMLTGLGLNSSQVAL